MAPPDGGTPEEQVVHAGTAHKVQLHICHEKIGMQNRSGGRGVEGGIQRGPRLPVARFRWCDLHAAAWCFDCDHYVCEIHLIAKHSEHRTQVEDL